MTSTPSSDHPLTPANGAALVAALVNALGRDALLLDEQIGEKYLADWSGERGAAPLAVVRPSNTEQVASVMALCHEHHWPVVPQGGMTGLAGGAVPSAHALVISLERLSGIEEIDSASATVTVLAGTPLQTVQEAVSEAGFYFALDLGARGSCHVGGNLATNAGGNRVIRYGMARDLVLGLEVVLPDGTVLPMLTKMVKNNAGPDLKGLFVGSEGTLGIITRAVMRLHPGIAGANTALVATDGFEAAIKLLRHAQQQLSGMVSAFELMWADYYEAATTVGGIRAPLPAGHPVYVLIDVQSTAPEAHADAFQAVLEHALEQGWAVDAAVAQSRGQAEDFWALRDSVAEMLSAFTPTINFDISFPISRIGEAVERLRAVMRSDFPGVRAMHFGHVGDGNVHIVVGPLPQDNGKTEHAIEHAFYEITQELQGSVSAEHGIGLHKKPYLQYSRSPAELALLRTLKQAVDPRNILNPGKIL